MVLKNDVSNTVMLQVYDIIPIELFTKRSDKIDVDVIEIPT